MRILASSPCSKTGCSPGFGLHRTVGRLLRRAATAAFALIMSIGIGAPHAAVPPPAPAADVLVLHDSLPGPLPSGLVVGYNVIDLLGHFGLKGNLVPITEYKPGDVGKYHFIIVLGVDDRSVTYPQPLISDIRSTSTPVFWVNRHIEEVVDNPQYNQKLGFRMAGQRVLDKFNSVSYKGKSFLKMDPAGALHPIEILDKSKVEVVATAERSADRVSMPYVVRSGSFWYCADSPFAFTEEGDRYLVFCDVLHNFFNMPHQEERKALLRLEDVSIEEDTDHLRELADYLYSRHIPFQISLIPIFRDPKENLDIYLSDRPQFVRAIRYMVSKGGVVVMHGATHQYRGRSGDDYEFWDEMQDQPIQGDSHIAVEQKLRMGLEECFKNGIYPVTWETPHYVASSLDYQTIARYFSSSYERVSSVNSSESGHLFPYPTIDRFGRFIIPECLGFVARENPQPERIVADANRLQAVRDGVASFFFHPFMDQAYLEKILDGLDGLGYKFISIRDYDIRVQMDERLVQTYTDPISLPIQGRYLHRFLMDSSGRISTESYSDRPLTTVVKDPGLVPDDSILVMEGLSEIQAYKEPPPPSTWDEFKDWISRKIKGKSTEASILTQPQAIVLWEDNLAKADWNNQRSYVSALSSFGFQVSTRNWKAVNSGSIDSDTILIVPHGVAVKLSPDQVSWIAGFVRDGGRLIVDGHSALSQEVGLRPEKRKLLVSNLEDVHYGNQVFKTQIATWNPPVDVTRFKAANPLTVYAQDQESELPLAITASFGRGRVLYLAARLDPVTQLGYTRYPYFVHYVLEGFNLKLPVDRAQVELYYDGGSARGGGADIDKRVEAWRQMGIRAIYASAFVFWPNWSYPYAHLIDVCHKNGILVYAWFELPHVSVKFWNDHPEWRAKTATGADGLVGWRHHMDLDNPDCREAAFAFAEDLLRKYPWDGINIAELNYDSNGPEDPAKYIPMGAPIRTAFKALGGFDPILLFSPESPYYWRQNPPALKKFEEYRAGRVMAWHRALLDRLTPLARERDLEIIVTMLDSLHSPTVSRDTGVNSRMIVGLMDQYPFTLQVEDPASFWAHSPDRYRKFGETYLPLVKDPRRLMFDINVVPVRDITHSLAPMETCAGVELVQTYVAAVQPTGRAAIYSEGTMPLEDLQMLSKVLAHQARVERKWDTWVTESEKSIEVEAPGQWQNFRVDDQIWPGWSDTDVLIPGGNHRITAARRKFSLFDTSVLDIRLVRFTGNLDTLVPSERGLQFGYDSQLRAVALFNRRPHEVHIDGEPYAEPPVSYSGRWSVRLPRGKHKVDVIADDTATVILDTTSLYSSTLIVIFGGVACGLMLLLYMSILARRAISRAVHGKAN